MTHTTNDQPCPAQNGPKRASSKHLATATQSESVQKAIAGLYAIDDLPNVERRLGGLLDNYMMETEDDPAKRMDYFFDIRGLQQILHALHTEIGVAILRNS